MYGYLASPFGSGWKGALAIVRKVKRRAVELVFAHRETIRELAFHLHERGTLTGAEAESAIEEFERELNEETMGIIEAADPIALRNADVSTLARLYVAGVRILARGGLPMAVHHRWRMAVSWARAEAERRGLTLEWLEERGRLQAAAVDRMVTAAVAGLRDSAGLQG
ncbi:MAG: hypothetical protein NTY38_22250 [Acidobacteria bacterium]|nr:hypothetical protein [Acidobacteriota bacterium]